VTPRILDEEAVQAKLRLMRQLLEDLQAVGAVSSERLRDDRLLRYAVERILTQLVDLAVSVNSQIAAARLGRGAADYRSSFQETARVGALSDELAVRLAPSAGLRNVLTHDYVEADLDIVTRSVARALADYGDYVRSVARWLPD